MAAAHSPIHVEPESEMHTAAHNIASSPSSAETDRSTLNPALIAMLIAVAAYPFVVGYLPEWVRQYLGSLFR
jgi:hypothetical protein